MAGTFAHEIKNPLAALTNAFYLMRDEALPDRAREYFNVAERELLRISSITEQALAFYRKTEGSETVSVASILDEAVGLFAEEIRSRNISVEHKYKGFGQVVAHRAEMRQLLTNLIANGVESGATRLAIRVSACPDWTGRFESGLRVIIADNGRGIRTEDRPRIFHPSFTTKPQKGAGLGLWVARSIVEKYRGRIVVKSRARPDAHGTSVSVFLPAVGVVLSRSHAA
jgi:signal transduction histidine kinase